MGYQIFLLSLTRKTIEIRDWFELSKKILHFILSVFFSSNKKNKFKNSIKLIYPIYIFKFEIIRISELTVIITDKEYFAAGPEFSRNLYTYIFSSIQHVPPLCSGTTSYTLTYVQVHSWILRILELNDLNWFLILSIFLLLKAVPFVPR